MWATKYPYVVLKFETAALCTANLAKLNKPKRQRKRWKAQALGDVRIQLSYDEPKAEANFRVCVDQP